MQRDRQAIEVFDEWPIRVELHLRVDIAERDPLDLAQRRRNQRRVDAGEAPTRRQIRSIRERQLAPGRRQFGVADLDRLGRLLGLDLAIDRLDHIDDRHLRLAANHDIERRVAL